MHATMMSTPLSLNHLLDRACTLFPGTEIVSRLPDKSLRRHTYLDFHQRTGDKASVDALGFVRITDRTKDLIKSGGEWISSVDLENALMGHPAVAEAAVIAIPDEKWSERPLA